LKISLLQRRHRLEQTRSRITTRLKTEEQKLNTHRQRRIGEGHFSFGDVTVADDGDTPISWQRRRRRPESFSSGRGKPNGSWQIRFTAAAAATTAATASVNC